MSSNLKEDILRAARESQCRDIECTSMKIYRKVFEYTVIDRREISGTFNKLLDDVNYIMSSKSIISIHEEVDDTNCKNLYICRLIVYYRDK